MKVCIVAANYYKKNTESLFKGACKELDGYNKLKINKKKIKYKKIMVPGVFEIPFVIVKNIKNFDAFIALGCVIKGETPHFDFISNAATNAIMQLSIKFQKPITNGIITCLNMKQALRRSNPGEKNKGGEAAKALIKLFEILKKNE
tara:strand:+ start:1326 stop:1763 length:438 start_codon:yes stop_codon:yes gene_type:complete